MIIVPALIGASPSGSRFAHAHEMVPGEFFFWTHFRLSLWREATQS